MAPVCRICLDAEGALIQPCGCQGSMKWVHAECLAQWWHHRSTGGVDLPEVDSLMRCDVCGEALALVRTCHAGHRLFRFFKHRLQGCREALRQLPEQLREEGRLIRQSLRERIGGSKIHGSSLLLCLLMFWWTLGAMRVPGPSTSSTLSPRAVHFMELGCWTFPVFLWWSVLRLAINSSVTGENWLAHLLRLDQEEWRHLFVTICICLLMVCAMSTFASGLGPGLQSDPVLAHLNFAAVLSPLVPLVAMIADPQWLWHWWPPIEDMLEAEVHLPWVAGIFAIMMSNLLMAGFMSFSNHMALLIVDLLPETRAHREKLQENMRHMDPIYGLLVATHVLSSIFASLHLPTMLRSLMFLPSEWAPEPLLSELHTNQWSKLGAIVIFIASGDLLWLAIYGSPWCIYIVELWSLTFLELCRRLGAAPFTVAAAIICFPLLRCKTAWRLQIFRDSLRCGEVNFTNREPRAPLLAAGP